MTMRDGEMNKRPDVPVINNGSLHLQRSLKKINLDYIRIDVFANKERAIVNIRLVYALINRAKLHNPRCLILITNVYSLAHDT